MPFSALARVKDVTGKAIDDFIPKPGAKTEADFEPFRLFLSDPFAVFDFFWALIKPQAESLGITKEVLMATGFDEEDASVRMREVVVDAIANFFQKLDPPRALMITQTVKAAQKLAEKVAERRAKEIQTLNYDLLADALPGITTERISEEITQRLKSDAGV